MLNTKAIREAMKLLGFNQPKLAEMCNVSKEAVSNWLSGESMPRPSKLKALGDALQLSMDTLLVSRRPEPVVAYRTQRNRAVTGKAKEAAEDIARHLRGLVPFVQRKPMYIQPVLAAPVLEDDYIQEAALQVRSRLGVGPAEPISREQILSLHHSFGSFLVPVIWGKEKDGHENALSVLLPDSCTSWVVFSLNAKTDDFNYWLAHELGHCYSLHLLQDTVGEEFAESFARELLFPLKAAHQVLDDVLSNSSPSTRVAWYAGKYDISVVTVIKQLDKAAESLGRGPTGLASEKFWANWSKGRKSIQTVAEQMFGTAELTTEEYIQNAERVFRTPVFKALAQLQLQEGGRLPAFIAAVLNIDIGAAQDISKCVQRLHAHQIS